MKNTLIVLALLLPAAFANAELRFELPCTMTRYVEGKEVPAANPDVKTYTLVKQPLKVANPKAGEKKWDSENYFIEMLMSDKSLKNLKLVSAESGDEDYDEYRVSPDQEFDSATFWLSSGAIQYQFEWANFQGKDIADQDVFFRCE